MDYKEIVELALDGKDYAEKIKEFSPEQLKEVDIAITQAAKDSKAKTLTELSAIRQEKNRVLKMIEDAKTNPPPPAPESDVMEKFKAEQESEAKNEFFSDPTYQIPEELKATFEETYKALKKGEVSKSQILQVMKRSFAATMGDNLIESRRKIAEMEKGASAFNAGGANKNVQISEPDKLKYSKAAQELFSQWQAAGYSGKNYTLDRAQQITSDGLERKL